MSDKLKVVMEDFKALLRKHDLCGLVVLTDQDQLEYYIEPEATWTCARFLPIPPEVGAPPGAYGLRIRCKREDYPSREAQRKCLEDTLGSLLGIADAAEDQSEQMRGIAKHVIQSTGMELQHRTWKRPGR